jgi:RING-variant domain
MASMSPQQSPGNTSPSSQRQPQAETSSQDESTAPSMTSEDSQTVLLDNPTSSNEGKPTQTSQRRPSTPSRSSTLGIKKCWICICDSTEDDPIHPPRWRSPCTCNLTAHEACLLDWVADLESPKNRRGGPSKKIQCPQCKSEIKIARPKSLVLEGVRAWDRLTGTLTLPGMAGVLGGTIFAGCFYHGLHSVRVVFGEAEAFNMSVRAHRHWGWLSAYALIPLSLISARTNYADFVLPGSTVFLFATQLTDRFAMDWTIWPPRPSTVFGCLPVVRNCYNYLYEKAFGNLNRKWIQEIQPRQGQDGNDDERNDADRANDVAAVADEIADGDVILELNLEIGGVEDGEDEEQQPQHGARDQREAQPRNENAPPPAANEAANDNPPVNANANANPNNDNNPILNRRPNELISDTSSIFLNTLGALLFPSIASGMGELLHHTLPLSWIKPSSHSTILANNGREQLLRTKWGRSVVGGCLFVVLKDALVLYVRWRMARNHRGRRIMDFDKKRKEYVLQD